MGYYASGQGSVVLKDEVNFNEVIKMLENLPNSDIEFDMRDSNIDFWEVDSHWHEDDTFEFLEALIPYITEGFANYSGEDDCIWRYIYIILKVKHGKKKMQLLISILNLIQMKN